MRGIETLFRKTWPYWIAGIILALINIALMAYISSPWRVTSVFLYWGTWMLDRIGIHGVADSYVRVYGNSLDINEAVVIVYLTIVNIGVVLGAVLSTLVSSDFKFKKIKNKKQLLYGIAGGVMMGYGARIALGCNIGAYFSAIPSFSLHGWVFGLFMFVGTWIGCKLLYKNMI
ncbi:YeeE/YedE thiosulfate transporter family protein [Proteinivorax hydrogeniformans]|uniref:YeeE/YedE thiosulfate transporter family protein n=1 Tax=Proteinivorax hydrogeniformans TaxID=1826727 RepID=A0AAU8HQ89_9FIRM